MKRWLAVLTATVVVASAAPAFAQQSSSGVGRFLDTLSGFLGGGYERWHGTVVYRDASSVFLRADDSQTYRVDMTAVDPSQWQNLQIGQVVSLAAKPAAQPRTLIARGVQPDTSAAQSSHPAYRTVQGTVQSVQGSQMTFRANDGSVATVDLSGIRNDVSVTPNEYATLVYEQPQGTPSQVTALWVAPAQGQAQGTAGGFGTSQGQGTFGNQRSTGVFGGQQGSGNQGGQGAFGNQPSASVPSERGAWQRLHGYVQSVGVGMISLKTDDGRTLDIDTSQVPRDQLASVRPGDLVSVTGRSEAADRFSAEVVQPDEAR